MSPWSPPPEATSGRRGASADEVADLERKAEAATRSAAWVRSILEATNDAICVTDAEGRITDCNERFLRMWGLSAELVGRRDREGIRAAVLPQLSHPEEFLRRVAEIHGSDEVDTVDVIEFADGRVVERQSRLQIIEGRRVGRVWNFRDITVRRRDEEILQRNEAELRALADSMAQLAWMAESDGHIFWYNRRWYEYTGTTLERMRGWGWQEVHDPALLPGVVERWSRAVETGEPFEMELHLRGADGVFRWFLTSAMPMRDAGGRVVRWFGTNTDIDRAKRAEDALRAETRALELLNRAGVAIAARLDVPDLARMVTEAGAELGGAGFGAFFRAGPGAEATPERAGFALEACSGVPPGSVAPACEGRDRFLAGVFRGRVAVRRADAPEEVGEAGFPPTRSYIAVPVVSRSGELLGGLFFGHAEPGRFDARAERVLAGLAAQAAVAMDNARLYESAQREIAERARTEQRLRESEARLRASLQAAALGAWEFDAREERVTLDERARALLAPGAAERISLEEFAALAPADGAGGRLELLRRVCRGEAERYDAEYRAVGSGRWVRASAKPVRDGAGFSVGAVGALLDITDLVQARATTDERRRELQRLVDERTASLHQAITQMEEFSYAVSHDLRAPLRAIHGYAEAILEDCGDRLTPRCRRHVERILAAGVRMDRLTLDVLNYGRIAREPAPLSVVSLDRLVGEVVGRHAEACPAENITVERPLLPVRANEPLLAQVVFNLLANAFKFAAEGRPPRVRVWTEPRGAEVRLWCEDNGMGIRPEHHARIWGVFERIHPPERFEGTGIGLAIVRKAVERMGGGAGVESDGRNGSRFWVQLPAP